MASQEPALRDRDTGEEFEPHEWQEEVLRDNHRWRMVIAGRRWGKTLCSLVDLVTFMLSNPRSVCFWVVPKYKHLMPVSKAIDKWVNPEIIEEEFHLQKTYRYIRLVGNSEIWLHSANDPDSLRGPGLDMVILEEAAQLKEKVWLEIIHPELVDSGGKALIISTPKGKNWLYKEYNKARSGKFPEWKVWQRTSADRLTEEQMELEGRELPKDIFRQEFLAQFVEGGQDVFRGIRKCFKGEINKDRYNSLIYSDGRRLVPKETIAEFVSVGVDIGRHHDFTVFCALTEEGDLVGFERFRKLDYQYQKKRLQSFLGHFPRRKISLDARGIGESFFEEMRREGINVEPIKLTNPSKSEMVHDLVIKLDERKIRGPHIEELVDELEAFGYHITSSGNIIYEAPESYYDDCVIALAMSARNISRGVRSWSIDKGKSYMTNTVSKKDEEEIPHVLKVLRRSKNES